jgi:hypothetical protein
MERQRRTRRVQILRRVAVTIKRVGAVVTIIGLCFSSAAAAAGKEEQPLTEAAAAGSMAIMPPISSIYVPQPKRPAMLPALYATLGAMQAWDAYSTSAALKAGAHEANLAAAPFAKNTGALLGLKAATTASTIFFAERMWKKNRVGAVVLMAVINGATAAVAMNNMRNARVAAGR